MFNKEFEIQIENVNKKDLVLKKFEKNVRKS